MWWIFAIAIAIYCWIVFHPYKYWTRRGVDQGSPIFPFGHNWGIVFGTQSMTEMVRMVYNMSPNKRYSGCYQFTTPTLVLRDPDLIKQITVKDFDHFTDHSNIIPEDIDPLWRKNLFTLIGKKWREMRTTLSPAFTSSKMKYMFSLISQSGEQFKNFLKKKEDIVTVEMRDISTRFTNDIIANTAFGIECDSLEDRDNEFFLMGKEASDFTGFWKNIIVICYFLAPRLFKVFNFTMLSQKASNFFIKVIKDNIKVREKPKIVRPDMLNLLLEARKNGLKYEEILNEQDTGFATAQESEIGRNRKIIKSEITDLDITSQALIFFFAGFHTVSSLEMFYFTC